MPSNCAQEKLLTALGCKKTTECSYLQYRGNGWPGFTTAINRSGEKRQMNYEESWGKILGRDVRECCRFCFDGIGEFADIACGDFWYLTDDNKPDFREADGRNIVFARTDIGSDLLQAALKDDYLYLEDCQISELKYVQKYQYDRKIFMNSMIQGLKLSGRKFPKYEKKIMKSFASMKPLYIRLRRTLGIIKRIRSGKI